MKLLSIIIPVYNVSQYLERCLDSIINQTYKKLEIITIDDGSTDNSGEILDRYALLDSRILVFHKKNEGVSATRNLGLKHVHGEYLTFVDPDDFVAPDTFQILMNKFEKEPDIDIIQYPFCQFIELDHILNITKPACCYLSSSKEIFSAWWSGKPLEYVIWNKIYQSRIWKDLNFKVGHISEDTLVSATLCNKAQKIFICEEGLYYYQRARKGAYTESYSFEKHMDLYYAHFEMFKHFNNYPEMTTEKVLAFTRLFRRLIIAKETQPQSNIRNELQQIKSILPTLKEIYKSKGTKKSWIISAIIFGPSLFCSLFLIYLKLKKLIKE